MIGERFHETDGSPHLYFIGTELLYGETDLVTALLGRTDSRYTFNPSGLHFQDANLHHGVCLEEKKMQTLFLSEK